MPRLFGVIGHPISHSLSPLMHQAAFRALDLEAVYEAFDLPPAQLNRLLDGLLACGIDGLNVTVPHKEAVVRYLRRRGRLDPTAEAIGAVNTLVRRQGRFVGYNTDVLGLREVFRRELRVSLRGRKVLLLGAGGAARAAAWVVVQEGASVIWIANRTPRHAQKLATWLRNTASQALRPGRPGIGFAVLPLTKAGLAPVLPDVDVVINATKLGLKAGESPPLDIARLPKQAVVVDLVYRAPTTTLVQRARRRGLLAVDGLPMLLYQGAASFELWWHRKPPLAAMRRAVETTRSRRSTVDGPQ